MTYILSYEPAADNPDPSAVVGRLRNELSKHRCSRVSVSTWVIETDTALDIVFESLANLVPIPDLLVLSIAGDMRINHPTLPWDGP